MVAILRPYTFTMLLETYSIIMIVQDTLIKESLRAMMGALVSEASISSTNTNHFFLALSFHSLRPDGDRNEYTLWSVIL
jgi:hypothetical protein